MDDKDSGADMLTPSEMRGWLKGEIADSAKAFELRIREASELVASYALGELTPAEADERLFAYDKRWGEALYGATVGAGASDEAILAAIDKARSQTVASIVQRARQQRSGGHSF